MRARTGTLRSGDETGPGTAPQRVDGRFAHARDCTAGPLRRDSRAARRRTATAGLITLSGVELQQLARGLWRWTAPHPDWEPNPKRGSPADWPQDVGSVAYANDRTLVLVDPLVPESGWRALDRLAKGKRVHVLTTLGFHRRSREALRERYGADTSNAKARLPAGVETIAIRNAGERMVWIPEHGALVPGDRLLGSARGGLRVCPDSWLGYLRGRITPAALRQELRKLLDLPIRMVLVSHGEPVFQQGRRELERALA